MSETASSSRLSSVQGNSESSEQNINLRRRACHDDVCLRSVNDVLDRWGEILQIALGPRDARQRDILNFIRDRHIRFRKTQKVTNLSKGKDEFVEFIDLKEARFDSTDTISRMTGIHPDNIRKVIKDLVDKNLLVSTGRRGKMERELAFGPVLIALLTGEKSPAKVSKPSNIKPPKKERENIRNSKERVITTRTKRVITTRTERAITTHIGIGNSGPIPKEGGQGNSSPQDLNKRLTPKELEDSKRLEKACAKEFIDNDITKAIAMRAREVGSEAFFHFTEELLGALEGVNQKIRVSDLTECWNEWERNGYKSPW